MILEFMPRQLESTIDAKYVLIKTIIKLLYNVQILFCIKK